MSAALAERFAKRNALLAKLRECAASADYEAAHVDADRALLDYINDALITKAFDEVGKWYA